jgi:hypothetical protein
LKVVIDSLSPKELASHSANEHQAMYALTGEIYSIRVVQHKLMNHDCCQIILMFLSDRLVLKMQLLSKKFYDYHVPRVLRTMPAIRNIESFLSFAQMQALCNLFTGEAQLK